MGKETNGYSLSTAKAIFCPSKQLTGWEYFLRVTDPIRPRHIPQRHLANVMLTYTQWRNKQSKAANSFPTQNKEQTNAAERNFGRSPGTEHSGFFPCWKQQWSSTNVCASVARQQHGNCLPVMQSGKQEHTKIQDYCMWMQCRRLEGHNSPQIFPDKNCTPQISFSGTGGGNVSYLCTYSSMHCLLTAAVLAFDEAVLAFDEKGQVLCNVTRQSVVTLQVFPSSSLLFGQGKKTCFFSISRA